MSDLSEVKIFSGENSKYIAEKIAKSLNLDLGQKTLLHFSDGEFATSYDETVRGDHVFIVQSTFPPSDNLLSATYPRLFLHNPPFYHLLIKVHICH